VGCEVGEEGGGENIGGVYGIFWVGAWRAFGLHCWRRDVH